jgi:hypothetical protein
LLLQPSAPLLLLGTLEALPPAGLFDTWCVPKLLEAELLLLLLLLSGEMQVA